MARRLYGASSSDYAADGQLNPVAGAEFEVYESDLTTRVTDLQTVGGLAIDKAVSDPQGYIRFLGRDDGPSAYWLLAGGRYFVIWASDIGDRVDSFTSTSPITTLGNVAGVRWWFGVTPEEADDQGAIDGDYLLYPGE